MPITFEELVRPFQENSVTPPQLGVLSVPKPTPNVNLIVGAGGQGKILNGSGSENIQLYMDKKVQELAQPPLGRI